MKIKLLGWFVDVSIKNGHHIFNYFLDIDGEIVTNYKNVNDKHVVEDLKINYTVLNNKSNSFRCIEKHVSDKNIKCIESQILKNDI